MHKFTVLISALLATALPILAQTSEELRTESKRLRQSATALPKLPPENDQEAIEFIRLLADSHSLTLIILSNHRLEQPDTLTDAFLKSCKIISNQTEKLVLVHAALGKLSTNKETGRMIGELNMRYADIYKLLSPAVVEFDRRQLKLE